MVQMGIPTGLGLEALGAVGRAATKAIYGSTNGRAAHGYNRAVTYRPRRKRLYKRVGKKRVITKSGVNSMIMNRIMTWKSYHHLNDLTYALTGSLTGTPRIGYLDYTNIAFYDPTSSDAQRQTILSSRQSNNIFVDRVNVAISTRVTHNHAVNIRFICFFNNSWTEALVSAGNTPATQPANLDNLFKNWLTRVDEQVQDNARIVSNQKFNQDLVVKRRGQRSPGLLLDKNYYISPFQSPSGGSGGEADTLSLRQFNFSLPLKMWWNWENAPVDTAAGVDMKKGKLIFVTIVTSADPTNTNNTGNVEAEYRTSVVFKENS